MQMRLLERFRFSMRLLLVVINYTTFTVFLSCFLKGAKFLPEMVTEV